MEKGNIDFSVSLDNVKGMPFDKYDKNFTFIINDKRYETNRCIADFLSPIIRQYHYIDETIDYFTINTNQGEKSSTNENDYFTEFLKLTEFTSQSINDTQQKLFIEYFIKLGNIKEYLRLQPDFFKELNPQNVIDRLNFLIENIRNINKIKQQDESSINEFEELFSDSNIHKMIKFASSHFTELNKEDISKLPIDIISEILKDESLNLEDEDELLDFINELYKKDIKYSNLYEYVKFENLREETISNFIEIFNIEDLTTSVWKTICKRLCRPKNKKVIVDRNGGKIILRKLKEGKEFNGIMRYLSFMTHGNIHDNKTIEITSNSIYSNYHPKNLVDYLSGNYYEAKSDVQDATICFDFKDKRIQVSSYSIQTFEEDAYGEHLKNWVVEVSNDGKSWHVIDKHENDPTMNNRCITATFKTKEIDAFYRFIRLRQTGQSWCNSYYFRFYFIDFHGKLKIPPTSS